MPMKFSVNVNGVSKQYTTVGTNLRQGFFSAVDVEGKMVNFTVGMYNEVIENYVNDFINKGVQGFVFVFEKNKIHEYYFLTCKQVLENKLSLFSFNTDGKFLAVTYRATKKEIDFLRNNALRIKETDKDIIYNLKEINPFENNGFIAEIDLFGNTEKTHNAVDGQININGKNESVQLKTSVRNSSRSRSKTCNIWSARNIFNFEFK